VRAGTVLLALVIAGMFPLSVGTTGSFYFKPHLGAFVSSSALGAATELRFGFSADKRGAQQELTDDPTGRIVVYVPAGFQASLGSDNRVVGSANAKFHLLAEDRVLYLEGKVTQVAPSSQAANSCSPGRHAGAWVAAFDVLRKPLRIPIYIDPVDSSADPPASYKIELCFPPPLLPADQGGPPYSGRFFTFSVGLGVWRTPRAARDYTWRGVFTPLDSATGAPLPSAAVESRLVMSLPISASLRVVSVRRGVATLQGALEAGSQPIAGANVRLLAGPSPKRLGIWARRRISTPRFTFRQRLTSPRTYFRIEVDNATVGGNNPGVCPGPSLAPAGCVTSGYAYFAVASKTVLIRRR